MISDKRFDLSAADIRDGWMETLHAGNTWHWTDSEFVWTLSCLQ